jgi:hypothetical protein
MKFRRAALAMAVPLIFLVPGCGTSGQGVGQPAPEKTNIVVDAFPAIDSAGLYIAQMDHLFAAQGLNVTIETAQTTQTEIDGQVQGRYDITTGDYVTYIDNELTGQARLRIVAEASFLQPNVLALLVRGGSPVTSIGELKDKSISINAPDDIGTLLVDSLLVEHGAFLRALSQGQEIADTDRIAVELALGRYLQIPRQTAAFLSLPSFPTGVDPARLQRVVSAMLRFGLLPPADDAFRITSMTGA